MDNLKEFYELIENSPWISVGLGIFFLAIFNMLMDGIVKIIQTIIKYKKKKDEHIRNY